MKMNCEEKRLFTFNTWPANAPVDARRMAKAGFVYTGKGLVVECFLCHGRIDDWDYGDQAMARHRIMYPNCPFVLDPNQAGNIPLTGTGILAPTSQPQIFTGTTAPNRYATLVARAVTTPTPLTPPIGYFPPFQSVLAFHRYSRPPAPPLIHSPHCLLLNKRQVIADVLSKEWCRVLSRISGFFRMTSKVKGQVLKLLSQKVYKTAPPTLSTAWTAPQSMFSKPTVTSSPLYSAPMRTPLSIGSLGGHYRSCFPAPMGSSLFSY
uniref:Uncharacterized protein n=1 Tax=Timema cristinae TaxID=61476 RepID=A0A7R9CN31_TIMCR|nr:unnamed protein product [Timema cristinae]